jgi:hypothetical protein
VDNTLDVHASYANISSRTWYQKISPLFVAFVSKPLNLDPCCCWLLRMLLLLLLLARAYHGSSNTDQIEKYFFRLIAY